MGVAGDADNFGILIVLHETEANGFSNRIAVREEAVSKTVVHDGELRLAFVVGRNEFASAKKRDSEVEKARRDHRCIGQSRREPVIGPEAVTEIRPCQMSALGTGASERITECTPGTLEMRSMSCWWREGSQVRVPEFHELAAVHH